MKSTLLDRIYMKAPTQKKKIEWFFKEFPSAEEDLETFLQIYKPFMKMESITIDQLADAYLWMITQMLHCRIEFTKTGCYPSSSQQEAIQNVYENRETMEKYMLGVALSYYLWWQHYQLLSFYIKEVKRLNSAKHSLEVGCGPGLFLIELLKNLEVDSLVDVVDISPTSIELCSGILKSVAPDFFKRVQFNTCDILHYQTDIKYDFITMGEVLEHVENPKEILEKLGCFLADDGRIFITTCANSPAIDHIYHFKSIQEIRDMIGLAGFSIERELIAPSENRSEKDLEKFKIDISYAATLKKEG